MSKLFKHLHVPSYWRQYWTKYPEGYTILEALINWVGQVNDMVDNQNELSILVNKFRKELDEFIDRFDTRLQEEVRTTLNDWLDSGLLEEIISATVFKTKVTKEWSVESMMKRQTTTIGEVMQTNYYYDDPQYGGGGLFYFDMDVSKEDHNGGTIIDPQHIGVIGSDVWYKAQNTGKGCWVRVYEGDVKLKWFGAKNDKTMDCSFALQSAINWCARQKDVAEKDTERYVEPLDVGYGNYLLERTVNITTNGHYIYGDGEGTAIYGDKTVFPVNGVMINIDIPEHGYFRMDQIMLVGAKGGSSEIARMDFIPTLHGIRGSRLSHSTKGLLSNINDVSFYGFSRGLELNSSWLLLISSCSFVGSSTNNKNGQGVYLGGGTGSNIPNGFGYNSIKFEKCNFQYLNEVGYANYGRNLTFEDCSLESCHNGIRLNQTRGATLRQNYIEALTGYTFSIGNIYHNEDLTYEKAMEVSLRTSNIVIEENTYQGTATFVSLQGCHKVTIKNNHQNGYNLEGDTSQIGGSTVAISDSVVEGRGLLVDCVIEYWKSYQLASTPEINRPATIFSSALSSIDSQSNTLVEMLTRPLMNSGNNARGEYIKLNDGTLICSANNLDIVANNNTNFQFPHAFIEDTQPIITGSLGSQGYSFYANSSKNNFAVRAVGESGEVFFSYIAIGRWK